MAAVAGLLPRPATAPAPDPALLQLDDVSLEYATKERVVRATHRVSFDVHRGERFVLLGASGCGKSSLLKAVAMNPRVLLMDEPFASLDALTRRRMQEELLALWDEIGFTLLFVTHSIEEALVVGSRIGVLSPRPGRLRAELNAHGLGLHNQGRAEFQAQARRIHGLLFDGAAA
ncbi:MAG TPA: ATP-binding cassette domain-containing protein [Burkholderiaceae bacterium]|nr:ATP-binding cassette domain-containing protein [Burkholderiaceae bacterium]